jgi:hypothetical protein
MKSTKNTEQKKTDGAKLGCMALFGVVAIAFLVTMRSPAPEDSRDPRSDLGLTESIEDVSSALPSYRIVEEIPYDAPIKTQIEYRVALEEPTDAATIQRLLEHLLDVGIKRRGFSNHGGRSTHVFAYVYPSEEHTGANWIGMVSKIGRDATPRFSIKKELLNSSPSDEWKFGLPLNKRKEIFREAFILEDTARIQAEATYPLPDLRSPSYSPEQAMPIMMKQLDEQRRMEDKLQEESLKRYGISADDLAGIIVEGFKSNWPHPQ